MHFPVSLWQGKHFSLLHGVFHGSKVPSMLPRAWSASSTYMNLVKNAATISILLISFFKRLFSVRGMNHTVSILWLFFFCLWFHQFLWFWFHHHSLETNLSDQSVSCTSFWAASSLLVCFSRSPLFSGVSGSSYILWLPSVGLLCPTVLSTPCCLGHPWKALWSFQRWRCLIPPKCFTTFCGSQPPWLIPLLLQGGQIFWGCWSCCSLVSCRI